MSGEPPAQPDPLAEHTLESAVAWRGGFLTVHQETVRVPDGVIAPREFIRHPGAVVMLAEECQQMDFYSPVKYGGSSTVMHCYVPDVDSFAKTAEAAGATVRTDRRLPPAMQTAKDGLQTSSAVDF